MIDYVISFLIQKHFIAIFLVPIVLLAKIILFIKNRTRSWKVVNFFYFDSSHIISSRSNTIESAKKTQNILSIVILVLIIVQFGLAWLIGS